MEEKAQFFIFSAKERDRVLGNPLDGWAVLDQGCSTGRRRSGVTFLTTPTVFHVHQNYHYHLGILFSQVCFIFLMAPFRNNLFPAQNT